MVSPQAWGTTWRKKATELMGAPASIAVRGKPFIRVAFWRNVTRPKLLSPEFNPRYMERNKKLELFRGHCESKALRE